MKQGNVVHWFLHVGNLGLPVIAITRRCGSLIFVYARNEPVYLASNPKWKACIWGYSISVIYSSCREMWFIDWSCFQRDAQQNWPEHSLSHASKLQVDVIELLLKILVNWLHLNMIMSADVYSMEWLSSTYQPAPLSLSKNRNWS